MKKFTATYDLKSNITCYKVKNKKLDISNTYSFWDLLEIGFLS